MSETIAEGQWIDAYEGIGKVLSIHEFFVEEFSPDICRGKKLGEHLLTLCVYKILCDFGGQIRKRNLIRTCNISVCRPLCAKSQAVLENVQEKNVEDYKRFNEFKSKSPVGEWVNIWLDLPEAKLNRCKEFVDDLNVNLSKPFTYPEFRNMLDQSEFNPGLGSMHQKDRPNGSNFIISLFNEDFRVQEKRTLFTQVKGVINSRLKR